MLLLLLHNQYHSGSAAFDKKTKPVYLKHDGRLLAFKNEADLRRFNELLDSETLEKVENKPQAQEIATAPIPDEIIPLKAIEQVAQVANEADYYQYLVKSQQYEALLKLYERFIEEEEIELLLMAA